VDNRVRNIWHCVVRFSALRVYCGRNKSMKSEKRELRERIREFVEQNQNSFGRTQQTASSDQNLNNIVNINIGTDEKPKYVWRVCK
jgi:hypothetical protein